MPRKKQEKSNKSLITLCSVISVILFIALLLIILNPNEEKWIQDGSVITKGDESYKIGDYYDYDESNDGKITNLTDVKWKVLGVDENGALLILSASNVEEVVMGSKDDLEKSKKDYIEGVSKLDDIAKKYGNGNDAVSARSIRLSDINKITNYKSGENSSYGNQKIYYWGSSENPMVDVDGEFSTSKTAHNGNFIWYDTNSGKWVTSVKNGTETSEDPTKICILTNTLIAYDNDIDYQDGSSFLIFTEEDNEFKMLYLDNEGNNANYWVADLFVNTLNNMAGYGYPVVKHDAVNYTYMVYSLGVSRETTAGVRVVVTID